MLFSRHDRVRASSRLISRRATASRAVYAASRADGKTIPASSPLSAQRNIELGRVCLVNLAADPLYGKLVTIVDFVDMNRVRIAAKHRAKRARRGDVRARARKTLGRHLGVFLLTGKIGASASSRPPTRARTPREPPLTHPHSSLPPRFSSTRPTSSAA